MSAPTVTFTWKMAFRGTRGDDQQILPTFLLADFDRAAIEFAKEFAKGRGLEPFKGTLKVRYTPGRKKKAA